MLLGRLPADLQKATRQCHRAWHLWKNQGHLSMLEHLGKMMIMMSHKGRCSSWKNHLSSISSTIGTAIPHATQIINPMKRPWIDGHPKNTGIEWYNNMFQIYNQMIYI